MQLHIEMPGECEYPGDLLGAIDRALAGQQLAPAVRDDLRLIAEEVVCNALEHGLPGVHGQARQLVFDLTRRGDSLHVEFRDTGKPFDPLAHPRPTLMPTSSIVRSAGSGCSWSASSPKRSATAAKNPTTSCASSCAPEPTERNSTTWN